MLKYLLDTNTISEPARPSPNRLPPPAKRTRIEGYLFGTVIDLPILPYDAAASEWHATERARLEAQGRTIHFLDRHIAAIASVHDCIVVTANVDHFESFEGIRIENWME
jgi:predicted nucleic acid-binding protein